MGRGERNRVLPAMGHNQAAERHNRDITQVKPAAYQVVLEQVTQKRQKLNIGKAVLKLQAPQGFTFVPLKEIEVTEKCKSLARQAGAKVHLVSTSKGGRAATELSKQVGRVGHHFPTDIVQRALRALSYDSAGEARFFHDSEHYHETIAAESSRKDQKGTHIGDDITDPAERKKAQEKLNAEARAQLKVLFPRIPEKDIKSVIKTAFVIGKHRIGTATEVSLDRRVNLAVLAHIRHTYTKYDELLKQVPYQTARSIVEVDTLKKIVEWRDEAKNDQGVEEILREVIVIPDDEDEIAAGEVGVDDDSDDIEVSDPVPADEVDTRPNLHYPRFYRNAGPSHAHEVFTPVIHVPHTESGRPGREILHKDLRRSSYDMIRQPGSHVVPIGATRAPGLEHVTSKTSLDHRVVTTIPQANGRLYHDAKDRVPYVEVLPRRLSPRLQEVYSTARPYDGYVTSSKNDPAAQVGSISLKKLDHRATDSMSRLEVVRRTPPTGVEVVHQSIETPPRIERIGPVRPQQVIELITPEPQRALQNVRHVQRPPSVGENPRPNGSWAHQDSIGSAQQILGKRAHYEHVATDQPPYKNQRRDAQVEYYPSRPQRIVELSNGRILQPVEGSRALLYQRSAPEQQRLIESPSTYIAHNPPSHMHDVRPGPCPPSTKPLNQEMCYARNQVPQQNSYVQPSQSRAHPQFVYLHNDHKPTEYINEGRKVVDERAQDVESRHNAYRLLQPINVDGSHEHTAVPTYRESIALQTPYQEPPRDSRPLYMERPPMQERHYSGHVVPDAAQNRRHASTHQSYDSRVLYNDQQQAMRNLRIDDRPGCYVDEHGRKIIIIEDRRP